MSNRVDPASYNQGVIDALEVLIIECGGDGEEQFTIGKELIEALLTELLINEGDK